MREQFELLPGEDRRALLLRAGEDHDGILRIVQRNAHNPDLNPRHKELLIRCYLCCPPEKKAQYPPAPLEFGMEMITEFAKAESVDQLPDYLPAARRCLARRLGDLRAGRVPLEELLVSQRLSRELDRYRTPSPAARAAQQLAAAGRSVRPGQRVRFLHLLGQPDVHAWDLPTPIDPRRVELVRKTYDLINEYRFVFSFHTNAIDRPSYYRIGQSGCGGLARNYVRSVEFIRSLESAC